MKQLLHWIDLAVYVVVVVLALWLGPRGTLWYVGLGISAAAALFWLLARWQLGRSFSVRAAAHRLVTHGLYAKIRHPVYVFGSLALLGAFLALQVWPVLIIWLVVVLVEYRRARREEQVLEKAFGTEYVAYRNSTWF